MKSKKFMPGTFVSRNDDENSLYFIISSQKKYGNSLFTCLPVIHKTAKTKYDRYVYPAYKDMLIVLSRPEQFYDYMLHYEKPRMAEHITREIINKFNLFDPTLYDTEKTYKPTSDGFRYGNPWEGMQLIRQKPKVYRG